MKFLVPPNLEVKVTVMVAGALSVTVSTLPLMVTPEAVVDQVPTAAFAAPLSARVTVWPAIARLFTSSASAGMSLIDLNTGKPFASVVQ